MVFLQKKQSHSEGLQHIKLTNQHLLKYCISLLMYIFRGD